MDQTHNASEETRKLDSLPEIDAEKPALTPVGQIDDDDAESAAAYQSLMRHRAERRRKKIVRIAIAAGVIAAICIFLGVGKLISGGGSDGGEAAIPTEFVYRDDFRESISGTGAAKPRQQVTVAADLTGEVTSIDVAVGDVVFKGQQLMTIRNDSLGTDADEAWFKYKEAEAAENTAQEELNYVWGTSDDQTERDRVYIALMRARAATQAAYDAYEQAAQKARDRTVRAPIDGTVISLGDATVGQQLGTAPSGEGQTPTSPSSSTGILLADLSQMTVAVEVNEIDITKIAVGQHGTVRFSALPGVESEAVVTEIATMSSGGGEGYYGGNVTYTVTLLIEQPDPQLKPGMTASVQIDVQYIPGALCVSTSALMTDDGTSYYVLVKEDDGEFVPQPVTVIAEGSTTAVIEGAIAEGDEVQISGGWSGEAGAEDATGGMVMF
ncbi:MAG: efflux RND transporter periplasmic adaptor subunit [Atopobiaceae bacterium]|nr:efflux RND transporter periplasmic adaptor subunit [Atopobiaceae bacterium]